MVDKINAAINQVDTPDGFDNFETLTTNDVQCQS